MNSPGLHSCIACHAEFREIRAALTHAEEQHPDQNASAEDRWEAAAEATSATRYRNPRRHREAIGSRP